MGMNHPSQTLSEQIEQLVRKRAREAQGGLRVALGNLALLAASETLRLSGQAPYPCSSLCSASRLPSFFTSPQAASWASPGRVWPPSQL